MVECINSKPTLFVYIDPAARSEHLRYGLGCPPQIGRCATTLGARICNYLGPRVTAIVLWADMYRFFAYHKLNTTLPPR